MIVLTDPDRSLRSSIAKFLPKGHDVVEVDDTAELEHALAAGPDQSGVVMFGPNVPLDDALQTAGWLQSRGSALSTILVTTGMSAEVLHAAMRAGVRDVLPDTFTVDQLHEALDRSLGFAARLAGTPTAAAPSESRSKIITVFSTKGGCGKSVVASNLAMLLQKATGEGVALVDLDLQSGDLAIMLQLLPAWTIYDAAENLERLDGDALAGYLTPHRSGIHLLSAPLEPALAETISGEGVQQILYLLAEQFPYVIVDGPALFTDQVIAALDISHECVLMASLDVPSVKNLKLALQTFSQLGIGRDRIHVVLNRADSKVGLRLQEVEKSLGTQVDVAIPSSREVPLSINQGTPLAGENRRSSVVTALSKLTERIQMQNAPTTARSRRSILGRS